MQRGPRRTALVLWIRLRTPYRLHNNNIQTRTRNTTMARLANKNIPDYYYNISSLYNVYEEYTRHNVETRLTRRILRKLLVLGIYGIYTSTRYLLNGTWYITMMVLHGIITTRGRMWNRKFNISENSHYIYIPIYTPIYI